MKKGGDSTIDEKDKIMLLIKVLIRKKIIGNKTYNNIKNHCMKEEKNGIISQKNTYTRSL